MSKFLSIARSNTDKNVETCAILAGRMAKDQFTITNVIVPKQKGKLRNLIDLDPFLRLTRKSFRFSGTSDSCTMVSDDELFEYQFSHELLTLGWIHTHPSQTAFLSSVDLHNHYGYQVDEIYQPTRKNRAENTHTNIFCILGDAAGSHCHCLCPQVQ